MEAIKKKRKSAKDFFFRLEGCCYVTTLSVLLQTIQLWYDHM
jgi:hypothetical protein